MMVWDKGSGDGGRKWQRLIDEVEEGMLMSN